jgi:hypothetical protein
MNWIKKFMHAPRDYYRARDEHRIALADNNYAFDCLRDFLSGKRSQGDCRNDLRKRLEKSGGYFDENGKLLEQEDDAI